MFQKLHLNKIKILILILFFFLFIPNVKAIVNPTSDFYVNDYANVLDSETKKYIIDKSTALNNASGIQIVVTTVKNLEGKTIEDYSLEFARKAKIGSKDKNDGILILVSYEDRKLRIEVGYGLEGIITDGKAGRIRDTYMIPYLKNNNWNDGIKNGYDAIYKEIVDANNLNLSYDAPANSNNSSFNAVGNIYVGITIGFILGVILRLMSKKKKKFIKVIIGILYFIIVNTLFICFLFKNLINIAMIVSPFNVFSFILAYVIKPGSISFNSSNSSSTSDSFFDGGSSSSGGGRSSGGGGSFGGGGASGSF